MEANAVREMLPRLVIYRFYSPLNVTVADVTRLQDSLVSTLEKSALTQQQKQDIMRSIYDCQSGLVPALADSIFEFQHPGTASDYQFTI